MDTNEAIASIEYKKSGLYYPKRAKFQLLSIKMFVNKTVKKVRENSNF